MTKTQTSRGRPSKSVSFSFAGRNTFTVDTAFKRNNRNGASVCRATVYNKLQEEIAAKNIVEVGRVAPKGTHSHPIYKYQLRKYAPRKRSAK